MSIGDSGAVVQSIGFRLTTTELHFGYVTGHANQGVHMYYGIGLGTLVVIVIVVVLLF